MQLWQMQEAKAHMSELVKLAQTQGPQGITMHGRSIAVVLSREMYDKLTGNMESLLAFMQRSPAHDLEELRFERDKSLTREVEF